MKLLKLILFAGLAVVNFSCVKPPSTEINYGPEVQSSKVAEALNEALGPADPTRIKFNEYSEAQMTRLIRGRSSVDILTRTGISVTRKEIVGNQIQFYYVEDKIEYDLSGGGNDRRITRDFQECLNKDSLEIENCTALSASSLKPISEQKYRGQLDLMSIIKAYTEEDARVSYHNLSVTRSLEDPPDLVRNFENCMDIPNCKIRVIHINYDVVDWTTEEGEKIAVRLKISPDVPYLSRVMEKCQQGSIPVPQNGEPESEAPRYLLTFCDTVRNFRFGSTSN